MRKLLLVGWLVLGSMGAADHARAQFCPGVSPWVFDDVLASDPFCGFITKIAEQGVTLGCALIDANHRLYCPNAFVPRNQMAAFMARLGDALFPLTCATGQVLKWNGTAWTCANDNTGGGGGTVTSVLAGTGLQGSPNPITGAGSLNLASSYQLPQGCTNGQIPKNNGSGSWTCAADAGGSGTLTSLSQGLGITLSANPITTTGSIAVDTTYLQRRVSDTCAAGSSIRAIATDGTVTCQTDNVGSANAFVQGGNAFGATAILGTTDGNAIDVQVNGNRVMRYEPNVSSPNIVGGHSNNAVGTFSGHTVAGGGGAGSTCLDPLTGTPTRTCGNSATGSFGTVGGGYSNVASGSLSIVAGGHANTASGPAYSAVAGGSFNTASGAAAFVAGGSSNIASGAYSLAGGYGAVTQTTSGATTIHDGTFVWADSLGYYFGTVATNEFAARSTGGFRFITNVDGSGNPTAANVRILPSGVADFGAQTRQMLNLWGGGVYGIGVQAGTVYFRTATGPSATGGFSWFKGGVHDDNFNAPGAGGTEIMRLAQNGTLYVTGGTVGTLSDRAAKQDLVPVDTELVLRKIVAMPVLEWSYRNDPEVRHLGPTAQDFHAAFGLGNDERMIMTVDADGVALAAIQGLNAKLEAKLGEMRALREAQAQEFAELRRQSTVEIGELRRAVEFLLALSRADARIASAR